MLNLCKNWAEKMFYCPNAQCGYAKVLKEGEKCPECGALARNFGFRDSVKLIEEKNRFRKSGSLTVRQDASPIAEQTPSNIETSEYVGKKWEYKIEMAVGFGGRFSLTNLNILGEQGWEAVGVFFDATHSQTYVLFKREKPS
jgi:hypothetical protein